MQKTRTQSKVVKSKRDKNKNKSSNKKTSRFSKNPRLLKLNSHINFEREGKKTNARKTPTEVICCQCRQKFELPFKPRNPQVYCDECFKKRNKTF